MLYLAEVILDVVATLKPVQVKLTNVTMAQQKLPQKEHEQ